MQRQPIDARFVVESPPRPYSPNWVVPLGAPSPERSVNSKPSASSATKGSRGNVAIFWDLDLVNPKNNPVGAYSTIRHLASVYGNVKHVNAYIGHEPYHSEASVLDTLRRYDVVIRPCHKRHGKKPTIHHTMEEDIAFHVAIDHPETRTVVFVTGDRDFTYCSQTLKRNGVRVVVLIQNKDGNIVEVDASTYWPLKPPVRVRAVKQPSGGAQRQVGREMVGRRTVGQCAAVRAMNIHMGTSLEHSRLQPKPSSSELRPLLSLQRNQSLGCGKLPQRPTGSHQRPMPSLQWNQAPLAGLTAVNFELLQTLVESLKASGVLPITAGSVP